MGPAGHPGTQYSCGTTCLSYFPLSRKDKIWDFNGGIHPPEMKINGTPLRQVPLPQRFVIPLKQHIGAEGELCVHRATKFARSALTRGFAGCCRFMPRLPER